MLRTAQLLFRCLVMVPPLLWPVGRATADGELAKVPNEYRGRLVAALLHNVPCSIKADFAAQRLAILPPSGDKSESNRIIANVFNRVRSRLDGGVARPSFVDVIVSQRESALSELTRLLQTDELSDDELFIVVCSLARMGPGAATARHALRDKMTSTAVPAWMRASFEVALANVGDQQNHLTETIEKELEAKHTDRLGMYDGADYYFRTMCLIRPRGEWLNEQVIGRFTAIVRDPIMFGPDRHSERLRRAVIVLGLADLPAKLRESVLLDLNVAVDRAYDRDSLAAFEIALAMARGTPERARPILEELCRRLPKLKPKGDIVPMVIEGSETAYLLVNDNSARVLAEIVSSEDEMIAKQAVGVLMLSGLAGRAAVPAVLEFVKSDAPEDRRYDAATVLEYIADLSFVEKIKSAADTCRTQKVSDALRDVVKRIQFD